MCGYLETCGLIHDIEMAVPVGAGGFSHDAPSPHGEHICLKDL